MTVTQDCVTSKKQPLSAEAEAARRRRLPWTDPAGGTFPLSRGVFPAAGATAATAFRPGGIDIDHPRRDLDGRIAGVHEQRIQASPDQGVSAGAPLQFHLALDSGVSGETVGIKQGGTVVTFDDRDGAAGLEHGPEDLQCPRRLGQVLEHEADKGMVERRQREEVGLVRIDVGKPGIRHSSPGPADGVGRNVYRDESARGGTPVTPPGHHHTRTLNQHPQHGSATAISPHPVGINDQG